MLENGSVALHILAVRVRWGCQLGLAPLLALHECGHLLTQFSLLLEQLRKHVPCGGRCLGCVLVTGPQVGPVVVGSGWVVCWETVVSCSGLSMVRWSVVLSSGMFATVL